MDARLKQFNDVLTRLRIEYNMLRRASHCRGLTDTERTRVHELHLQQSHFQPLYRALAAFQQPTMADDMHGRKMFRAMLYEARLGDIRRVTLERFNGRSKEAFPDLQDVILYVPGGDDLLTPAKSLREMQADWAAQAAAEQIAQRKAYAELMASFNPRQRELLDRISRAGRVNLRLLDLPDTDEED